MNAAGGPDGVAVVLADGDARYRSWLHTILAAAGMTVLAEADTVVDGALAAERHPPDLLVVDPLADPAGSIGTIRAALRRAAGVAVLVLSERDDDESVVAALRAGARGYLLKGAGQDDLLRAVRGVAAGEAIFDAKIAGRVTGLLSRPAGRVPHPLADLSAREIVVLELVAAGLPAAAVARRLRLAPKTIRNHLSAIVGKLGVSDRAEAVARARAAGLARLTG